MENNYKSLTDEEKERIINLFDTCEDDSIELAFSICTGKEIDNDILEYIKLYPLWCLKYNHWLDLIERLENSFRLDKFKEFPSNIYKLKNLKTLIAKFNSIEKIQEELLLLTSVQLLDLQHNQIKSIPKDISKMSSLETLILNDNLIQEISPDIQSLKHLKFLYLQNNSLSKEQGEDLKHLLPNTKIIF